MAILFNSFLHPLRENTRTATKGDFKRHKACEGRKGGDVDMKDSIIAR